MLRRYVQSVCACLYLIAGGFFRPRHRQLLYTICNHFGFEQEPVPPRPELPRPLVPTVTLEQLLGHRVTTNLTALATVDGNVSPLELIVIAALVRQTNPALAFEIGTFDGRTTLNISLNQPPGAEVVTLDLPPDGLSTAAAHIEDSEKKYVLKPSSGSRFAQTATAGRITQVYGDSAAYDFSPYRQRIDFMFVDGSHSHDYVVKDSMTALSAVRPGGTILWHDYDTPYWPGLTTALNELQANNPAFKGLRHIAGTSLCVLQLA